MSARRHLSEYQFGKPDLDTDTGAIYTHFRGREVGHIIWGREEGPKQGMVSHIFVEKNHRRNGVATEMYRLAKQADSTVKQSDVRTPMGDKWSRSIGDYLPKNMAYPNG